MYGLFYSGLAATSTIYQRRVFKDFMFSISLLSERIFYNLDVALTFWSILGDCFVR